MVIYLAMYYFFFSVLVRSLQMFKEFKDSGKRPTIPSIDLGAGVEWKTNEFRTAKYTVTSIIAHASKNISPFLWRVNRINTKQKT